MDCNLLEKISLQLKIGLFHDLQKVSLPFRISHQEEPNEQTLQNETSRGSFLSSQASPFKFKLECILNLNAKTYKHQILSFP